MNLRCQEENVRLSSGGMSLMKFFWKPILPGGMKCHLYTILKHTSEEIPVGGIVDPGEVGLSVPSFNFGAPQKHCVSPPAWVGTQRLLQQQGGVILGRQLICGVLLQISDSCLK